VVCALLLAAAARAHKLAEVLTAMATSIREDISMRLRVEASRASARSGVRTVMVFSVAFAAVLLIFARSYLAPFGSVIGQFVLAGVGALYACGLAFMVRMVRPRAGLRLLGSRQAT
jgi:Flp pilus assembly protein TadB